MSVHLTRDLAELHHDILTMCAKVEEIIHEAVDGLRYPRADLATELAIRDDEIDQMDVRIEDKCLKALALHQPVAVDLRRITTVLKITAELERVADLGVNIAERAASLVAWPQFAPPPPLKYMSEMALDMLHRSIDSYVEMDSAMAREVCHQDDAVDELNREIIGELSERMKQSPETVEPGMQLFSATRHIERVADHATNIAEDVVYLVEGQIIRHRLAAI